MDRHGFTSVSMFLFCWFRVMKLTRSGRWPFAPGTNFGKNVRPATFSTADIQAEIPYSNPRPDYTGKACIQPEGIVNSRTGCCSFKLWNHMHLSNVESEIESVLKENCRYDNNSQIPSTPSLMWSPTASAFESGRRLQHCLLPFTFSVAGFKKKKKGFFLNVADGWWRSLFQTCSTKRFTA